MKLCVHLTLKSKLMTSRILRECRTGVSQGVFDHVEVVGLKEDGFPTVDTVEEGITVSRIDLKSKRFSKILMMQLFKYCEWVYRLLKQYKNRKVSVIHCHGLGTLPASLVLKWRYGCKLVYDAHELETESSGLSGMRKALSKIVERICIKHVDSVLVVSDSIAAWYEKKYPMQEPFVVRNVPYALKSIDKNGALRDEFGLSSLDLIFLYQGGFEAGRGIETMLDVFTDGNDNRHLVFMGYGSLSGKIKSYAEKYPNIHYRDAVSSDDLLKYTASADVGMSLIENSCLSYFYSLPNKLFEYMMAGLPIIGSDFPEIKKVIKRNDCGWVVDAEPHYLKSMIRDIKRADIQDKAEGAKKARHDYTWEKEQTVLLAAYNA